MAKSPARAAQSDPQIPNRERPGEPQRYEASKEELLDFYKQMLLIRRFEEKAGQLYGLGLIGGFCHLYIGQEAVAVGLQSALEVGKDSVITGYRDHGHMLAYGIDPKVIMAELTGRAAGISKGKGFAGTMKRHGFAGVSASHGAHKNHRKPGSVGGASTPGRVFKGQRMPGRMGAVRQTTMNLTLHGVDVENNLLLIKGAVPGSKGQVVLVRSAVKGA